MNKSCFRITIHEHSGVHTEWGEQSYLATIRIGSWRESFNLPIDHWKPSDYRRQWREGIGRLSVFRKSCLVTGMRDPCSAFKWDIWPLYREEDLVYIRNQIIPCQRIDISKFHRLGIYSLINNRGVSSSSISEWTIPFSMLMRFAGMSR